MEKSKHRNRKDYAAAAKVTVMAAGIRRKVVLIQSSTYIRWSQDIFKW